jgi:hypothetical protein
MTNKGQGLIRGAAGDADGEWGEQSGDAAVGVGCGLGSSGEVERSWERSGRGGGRRVSRCAPTTSLRAFTTALRLRSGQSGAGLRPDA